MNARQPMRRSGFASQWQPRLKTERTLTPIRVPAPSAAVFRPAPKHEYVRSPALLEACRALACQSCGSENGTIVAAHSNWAVHGKGKSVRADDNRVAAMCWRCHHELDQCGDESNGAKQAWWWDCHVKTVNKLVMRGLWPKGVPVPETGEPPAGWTL